MAKRVTKAMLEEENKSLMKLCDARQDLIYSKNNDINKLSTDVKNLEADKVQSEMENSRIESEKKTMREKLEHIIDILAGEASPESKAEVITDLLKMRIDKAKQDKQRYKEHPQQFHNLEEAFF